MFLQNIAQLFKQHYYDGMNVIMMTFYNDNNHKYIQHSLNKLLDKERNTFEIYCEYYAHE